MTSNPSAGGPTTSGGLQIPWFGLTITLTIVSVVSIGTLATVVSIKNIDTLSVVALALAVLSFSAQLIISLAQASSGAQQVADTERVNASTQAALAEIRATGNSLLSNQKDVFSQVLRAALPEVARELSDDVEKAGASGGLDQGQIEDRLEEAIDRALARISSGSTRSPRSARVNSSSEYYRKLVSYPDESEGPHYMQIMNRLNPLTAQRFGNLVSIIKDKAKKGEPHATVTLTQVNGEQMSPETAELIENNLIREVMRLLQEESRRLRREQVK